MLLPTRKCILCDQSFLCVGTRSNRAKWNFLCRCKKRSAMRWKRKYPQGKCCTVETVFAQISKRGKRNENSVYKTRRRKKEFVSKYNEKIIVHLEGMNKVGIKCQHFLIRFCLNFFANLLCLLHHQPSDFSFYWFHRSAMERVENDFSFCLLINRSLARSRRWRRKSRIQKANGLQEDSSTPQSVAGDWGLEWRKLQLFRAGGTSRQTATVCETIFRVHQASQVWRFVVFHLNMT